MILSASLSRKQCSLGVCKQINRCASGKVGLQSSLEVIIQVRRLEFTHLFHSERCGDLLAPEDHGPMGQDLGQLI